MSTCFVYGTLMFPEVLKALTGRVPHSEPAMIHNYRRFAIRNQVFPATVPSTSADTVTGLILYDLQPKDLEILDAFEGEEYYKVPIKAILLQQQSATAPPSIKSTTKEVETFVYIWQESLRHLLLPQEWDPDFFVQQHLESYTIMCQEFSANPSEWKEW